NYLEAHRDYVKDQYKKENFIASGTKKPRTGGVILAKVSDRKTLDEILECDPLKMAGIAKYEVVEFIPSMTGIGYENLK
ncbi:MAG: YciI family protein, partial [Acidaminobacteraceae bacterium]